MKDKAGPESNVYIALIHYPVYNKKGEIVTSAVTNLDIHDIARTAKTYGLGGYFIVNPDGEQQALARNICRHWVEGFGASYNSSRGEALKLVNVVSTVDDAVATVERSHGCRPKLFATTASVDETLSDSVVTYREAYELIDNDNVPTVILLGTGWGMTDDTLRRADHILEPVSSRSGYNHLSVRAAAAIIVDRLFRQEGNKSPEHMKS